MIKNNKIKPYSIRCFSNRRILYHPRLISVKTEEQVAQLEELPEASRFISGEMLRQEKYGYLRMLHT